MPRRSGFTLVELMVVLMIIGIIAGFVIPNILESRKAANESSAEKSLKSLVDAEATFMKADCDNDGKDFAYNLVALHDQTDAANNMVALIPSSLSSGSKEGYNFGELTDYDMAGNSLNRNGFAYYAVPSQYGTSGRRSYIVNQTGAIYYKDTGDTSTAGSAWSTIDPTANGWIMLGQ